MKIIKGLLPFAFLGGMILLMDTLKHEETLDVVERAVMEEELEKIEQQK
ncbi:hypothetical protein SAMN05192534_1264 [Alteribacillus persepolensis]|uniref:Uncharacterized protein n=1 Tax=Alteribacillus persepolensis TaxID=568899 RepID=A0A1G8IU49_9BACI|nr:hypothetical protein [Alteribacillus persepolensis]SDI22000.1 hypothetical protein SAMN05192534_1264 [Alteribacillus persepolensis]